MKAVTILATWIGAFVTSSFAQSVQAGDQRWYEERPQAMPTQVAGTDGTLANRAGNGAYFGEFSVPAGFCVERLFTVPKEKLGSWVCLTSDDKGRLLVSDQEKLGICRITPANSSGNDQTKVEHLKIAISGAQGMLYAFGSLYFSVNAGPETGLYRARDTNDDDQFDEVVRLRAFPGGGEHGMHALKLSLDGKSLLVVCGDHINPPFSPGEEENHPEFSSCIRTNWSEDLLLPRLWDPSGLARGRMAPGGWIAQTDPEGKSWRIISVGIRNAYDMDFNAEGELFTYDSDSEGEMGTPWYRATRICHATCGSEFGCRSGTGKWPPYYPDSLPPTVEVGPGSPVGVTFGYGTRFPVKYQRALFVGDWTYGAIYTVHLEPDGATYKGQKEPFLSRSPLPLTDLLVADGALYFITGGRNTQSELYRVTYVGDESTEADNFADSGDAELRVLRRKLESYNGQPHDSPTAVKFLCTYLGHDDRFIRYAARVALEFQPVVLWQEHVLAASDPAILLTGAIGLARQGEALLQTRLLSQLMRLEFDRLTKSQQLEWLRALQLVLIRMGRLDEAMQTQLTLQLDAIYPQQGDYLNRELCNLLVFLQSPNVVSKTFALFGKEGDHLSVENQGFANPPDTQAIHYLLALRNSTVGWSLDQRELYFRSVRRAALCSGGHSYRGYLQSIDREAYENSSKEERVAIDAKGIRVPFPTRELPKPTGPGHSWTTDEVMQLSAAGLHQRDFQQGRKIFAAARCIVCHRFGGDGGSAAPDLTHVANRFTVNDLVDSILEPSKVVSDQYRALAVQTTDGRLYTGRIIADSKSSITLSIDAEDLSKTVILNRGEIEHQQPSSVSLMPQGLLDPLNEGEMLDLIAYLLSRGRPDHPVFSPGSAFERNGTKIR